MKNLTDFRKTVETCVDPRLKGESYPQSHNLQSETPLHGHPLTEHGHLIITDSLLYPWGKKALTFSLNSTCLIRTPHYYRQFPLSLGRESSYIFSQFNLLYTDTPLILALFVASSVSLLTGIGCTFFQLNHTLPATKPNLAFRDRTSEMLLP